MSSDLPYFSPAFLASCEWKRLSWEVKELQEELAMQKSPGSNLADASELAMMLKASVVPCGAGLVGRVGCVLVIRVDT